MTAETCPPPAGAPPALRCAVALMSASILVIEVLHHQSLAYFTDYLLANLAINSALAGMAVGALAATRVGPEPAIGWLVGAPVGVMMTLWLGFAYLATARFDPVMGGVLLALPYAGLSLYLSVAYRQYAAVSIYATSLLGATAGIALVGLGYNTLGVEGLALVVSFAVAAAARCGLGLMEPARVPGRLRGWLGAICVLLALAAAAQAPYRLIALSTWSALYGPHGESRIHDMLCEKLDTLDFTRWNLEGRIDILRHDDIWRTMINGQQQDTITRAPGDRFDYTDPRFPPADLDTAGNALICGSSAEGVVKLVRPLVRGHVVGVELNSAVVDAMLGPFWKVSEAAYRGIDARVMDARSFVDVADEKLALLTLMSVHPPRRPIGIPEYLFTSEAFDRYFRLLGKDGVLNIEETVGIDSEQGAAAALRVLECVKAGLTRAGADPDRSILVHRWQLMEQYRYLHIIAHRKPFSVLEMQRVDRWMVEMDKLMPKARAVVHDPTRPGASVTADLTAYLKGFLSVPLPADRLTHPVTDDHPYIHPTLGRMEEEWTLFRATLLLALPWALVAVGFTLAGFPGRRRRSLRWLSGLALLGTAYLLVEMHLIHRLHLFLGSYSRAFIVALAGLFLASSLGAVFGARRWQNARGRLAVVLLATLSIGELVLSHGLTPLAGMAAWLKVAVALAVLAPVGFMMGVPFPVALEAARAELSPAMVPLALAANNALSVLGTGAHLMLSVHFGMRAIFLVALAIYAVALVLLAGGGAAGTR